MNEFHVVPIEDIIEHEESDGCVCGPRSESVEGGGWLVVHSSLDGREFRERLAASKERNAEVLDRLEADGD